jgi:hypothetical protein
MTLAASLRPAACAHAATSPDAITWHPLPPAALVGSGQGDVDVASVLAADANHPWLLGGDTIAADGTRSVAIWSAPAAPAGPWQPASFTPVSLDAPYDVILSLARTATNTLAFGSRASPLHGNPRPSVWALSQGVSWAEVPTLRELFGGENVLTLGGLAGGVHGFFLAGTWINAANRQVATVWRSADGTQWSRNDTDAALAGGPGEITSALDTADSQSGIVTVGTALDSTSAHPGAQRGAIWWSPDGRGWQREASDDPSLSAADQTTVQIVSATPDGWLAAGIRTTPAGSVPRVWSSPDAVHWTPDNLPSSGPGDLVVTGIATSGAWRFVSGVRNRQPVLWATRTRTWRPVGMPDGVAPGALRSVLVAAQGASVLIVLRGDARSTVWWTSWPGA